MGRAAARLWKYWPIVDEMAGTHDSVIVACRSALGAGPLGRLLTVFADSSAPAVIDSTETSSPGDGQFRRPRAVPPLCRLPGSRGSLSSWPGMSRHRRSPRAGHCGKICAPQAESSIMTPIARVRPTASRGTALSAIRENPWLRPPPEPFLLAVAPLYRQGLRGRFVSRAWSSQNSAKISGSRM